MTDFRFIFIPEKKKNHSRGLFQYSSADDKEVIAI